ncbi:hypothetical protein [Roseateles sp.]|uniref:hypothetical protein n=1 Tax=Roseateles sp. TaxID=1971397 RepID=UPI0025F43D1D|nr:hypothetical protein [Roseateles sp.]MBV8037634.1 hypothetical protein [Roseateles sp.]
MSILPRRWRLPYVALLAVVGLLQSVSDLQAYRLRGGSRPWEPFLWEFSSIAVIGLLALGVHASGLKNPANPHEHWLRG